MIARRSGKARGLTRRHLLQGAGALALGCPLLSFLAKAGGATPERLAPALALQRKAQWRLDFVAAENSMGFHAPAEAARILAESIDFARQGQLVAAGPPAPADARPK